MAFSSTPPKSSQQLQRLNKALASGAIATVRRILNTSTAPSEIAHLLETSPPRQRDLLWELVDERLEGEVLSYLDDDIQSYFLKKLDAQKVISVTEEFDNDDLVDLLQQLPRTVIEKVLTSREEEDRHQVEAMLSYPEDTAGGLMNTDTISVRPEVTIEVVLRYLRRHRSLPEMTDSVLVTNRNEMLVGILPITRLLVADPKTTVREIMETDFDTTPVYMPEAAVAQLFERHDLVSTPVVDYQGRLVGRITVDDVVDVIRDTADHSLMSMAGLDEEEDTFAPLRKTLGGRAIWLGINLFTALIASFVIGLFEDTLEKVVALAILMPIVASMGGIAGSQSLTLVIRGIALNQIREDNFRWLLNRETVIGIVNGLLWAIVVCGIAMAWFQDITIGLIIAGAMIINLISAAFFGTIIPGILKARNIDPALAGGVLLTTITDVIGFMSFLGLATLVYA